VQVVVLNQYAVPEKMEIIKAEDVCSSLLGLSDF
jgi:hypothetical protein